jgi:peptide/nickel transport system permease protein
LSRYSTYVPGRLLGMALTILVGAFVVFMVMKAAPGDPALAVLGEQAGPEAIAAFHQRYHLDAPILAQFWWWFSQAIQGDFGRSLTIAGGRPISALIAARLPNTLFIGGYALALAVVVSLVVGTIAALRSGRTIDTVATSFAVLGISMPDFWLSYVLIFALALGLGWFPSYGFTAPGESLAGAFYSGFLPAVAIAAPMAAVFARTLRAALLDITHREFVNVARSFGFGQFFVFFHFVFRNALIPYVTVIGLQVRYLLGGVVVIERIFGISGLGSLMVDAAFGRDYPVVQACAISFLAIVMTVNITVDLVCTFLDPRRSR